MATSLSTQRWINGHQTISNHLQHDCFFFAINNVFELTTMKLPKPYMYIYIHAHMYKVTDPLLCWNPTLAHRLPSQRARARKLFHVMKSSWATLGGASCNFNSLRTGKMAIISQTIFSNAFPWMKMYEFCSRVHWSLFLRFELTIFQHLYNGLAPTRRQAIIWTNDS